VSKDVVDVWRRRLPTDAVFVGATAAHIHGLDIDRDYVEIAVPPTSGIRSRRGLMVRHL
jgi:Arc/MetJ family transcription regulator